MTLFCLILAFISIVIGIVLTVASAFYNDPLLLMGGVVLGLLAWLLYKAAGWRRDEERVLRYGHYSNSNYGRCVRSERMNHHER